MSTKPNGGPAFPVSIDKPAGYGTDGMSLRDWFAGQALAGLVNGRKDYVKAFAEEAYSVADAMLAERRKTTEGGARSERLADALRVIEDTCDKPSTIWNVANAALADQPAQTDNLTALIQAGDNMAAEFCSWCPREVRGTFLDSWDAAKKEATQ